MPFVLCIVRGVMNTTDLLASAPSLQGCVADVSTTEGRSHLIATVRHFTARRHSLQLREGAHM